MTTRQPVTLPALVLVLAGALLVSGCATLPESGPVHRVAREGRRPGAGRLRTSIRRDRRRTPAPPQIVSDFLIAMQANPLSTSVARQFLSERATDGLAAQPRHDRLRGLLGAARLRRGAACAWPTPAGSTPAAAGAAARPAARRRSTSAGQRGRPVAHRQPGERAGGARRRTSTAASRASTSTSSTRPAARCCPTRCSSRAASSRRPTSCAACWPARAPAIGDVSRSALPGGTALDLSVVVTEGGVAEVPLSREVLTMLAERAVPGRRPARLDAAAGARHRQRPDHRRRHPVPMANGSIDTPVTEGQEYDAAGTGAAFFWGLRGGRVVDLGSDPTSIGGPLGKPGYALRSFAVSESPRRIAAVSRRGTRVLCRVGGRNRDHVPGRVRLLDDGTNVLRPQYDMFGDLWLVDRTADGARVLVVRGRTTCARCDVPGVTGPDVAAFAVARDGSRIAVAYAGNPAPRCAWSTSCAPTRGSSPAPDARARSPTAAATPRASSTSAGATRRPWPCSPGPPTRPARSPSSAPTGRPSDPTLVQPSVFRGAASALVVGPGHRPAAAPDHPGPAALHPRAPAAPGRARARGWWPPPTCADPSTALLTDRGIHRPQPGDGASRRPVR